MAETLERRVVAFLEGRNTLTLATVGPDGPWAADLFYVNDGLRFYWLSDPDARHSRNVARHPRVAVTIRGADRDWRAIRGVQMEGRAETIGTTVEAVGPMRLYVAKYPFLGDLRSPPPVFAEALAATLVYRFAPSRIYFIDNTMGLGYREELKPAR